MNKKIILLPLLVLAISGCSNNSNKGNDFTPLKNNETLYVGGQAMFRNNYVSDEHTTVISYIAEQNYTLNRSTYNQGNNFVYYNNYYYYWNINTINDTSIVGTRTVSINTTYSYLKYGKEENIAVRTKTETVTSYNYKSGYKTFNRAYNIQLNNYFASTNALMENCPELYAQVDTSTKTKVYVSTNTAPQISTNINVYNTYYYIEKF